MTIQKRIETIKDNVKDEKVLMAISGGVDSTVAAYLIHLAIKDNLTCLFVDTGLLRLGEKEEVMKRFKEDYLIKVDVLDAQDLFINNLKGITDPEEKRKIIGKTFIDVFHNALLKYGDHKYLAQGTILTDIKESDEHQTIKSHHNVGGLPKDLPFKLLEPLKDLTKSGVRTLGLELDLHHEFIYRKPFPGPGLGIRIMGEVTPDKIRIAQETDYILRQELLNTNIEKGIFQYFTVVTNTKTVGVDNGMRTYQYNVAIRAVDSVDANEATFTHIPFEVLRKISKRMINEVKGVNRITYDITDKPKGTIEWE